MARRDADDHRCDRSIRSIDAIAESRDTELHKGSGETTARADTANTPGRSVCANVRCLSREQHLWVTPSSRLRQGTRAPLLACKGPHSSFLLGLTKPALVVDELPLHALRVVINM